MGNLMVVNSKKSLYLAMIGVLVVSLAACSSSKGSSSVNSGGLQGTIKIGGTLGLTGKLSATSVEYQAIYDYWAQKVNASGGLLGRKVVMDIKNDNSTPLTAQGEYQTLLTSDKVDMLLAPYATFMGVPVVPVAHAAGKVLFNGGFVGLQYFDQSQGWMVGSYTYQEPDYSRGVFEALNGLAASQRPTKLGVLTNNNPFTIVARDGYKGQGGAIAFAKQAGMSVAFNETYSGTTIDFTAAVQKAKAASVDMFMILGLANDEDNIVKTMNVLGFKPKITCTCGSQATTLPNWTQLGNATNGIVGTTVAWPSQNFTGSADVASFSKSRGEAIVPTYDYVAYAILQVLQQAVAGAGTLDQGKIKDYIYSHTFDTAVGKIKYLSNGTPEYSEVITQTVNGQQNPVWPSSVATAKLVTQ
jgi:branched-chain amino acid transport system substrate-binding protein